MVGNTSEQLGRRLGGEQGQAGVDLIGIGPKNFAVEPGSQLNGEKRFADPGGAGNNDGSVIAQAGSQTGWPPAD